MYCFFRVMIQYVAVGALCISGSSTSVPRTEKNEDICMRRRRRRRRFPADSVSSGEERRLSRGAAGDGSG
jgi:hypothetical protein